VVKAAAVTAVVVGAAMVAGKGEAAMVVVGRGEAALEVALEVAGNECGVCAYVVCGYGVCGGGARGCSLSSSRFHHDHRNHCWDSIPHCSRTNSHSLSSIRM
jgi:hypothetical protein